MILEKSRVSFALLIFVVAGACAGPQKVAAPNPPPTAQPAESPPAREAGISETAARLAAEVPPPATGSVDTGLQLQFPQMDEQQIKDGLPGLRKQLRAVFPNSTDAQRQKMEHQAEDAMRRGGGVLLAPQ